MRPPALAMLLVLAFPLLGAPALAQDASGAFYEDPENDTELETFGLPVPEVPVSSAETAPADLRALDVQETDDALALTLTVQGLATSLPYRIDYRISFAWSDAEFTVGCSRNEFSGIGGSGAGRCYISAYSEDEGFLDRALLDSEWDSAAGAVRIALPKVYVLDEEERSPTRGDVLKDLVVRSTMSVTSFGFFTRIRDDMPGDKAKDFPIRIGDEHTGHLRLTTEDRVRVSNGGATTFVFQANLTNAAEVEDTVRLAVVNAPADWNVTLQTPLRTPPQSSTRVVVLVSVPFGHDHGGYSAFNLTAQSERDPGARASLRMGVLHTPIPQPAGHHDELFLHAQNDNGGAFQQAFPSGAATMNTMAPDETDAAEARPVASDSDGFVWEIPLDPGLGMGLDFDLERLGSLVGSIRGRIDAEATVSADLFIVPVEEDEEDEWRGRTVSYDLGDGVLLAESDAVDVALTATGVSEFALTMTPTPESDYIPYAPRQNLVLRLDLSWEGIRTFCCLDNAMPTLETEPFLLKLPLNEYHDRLTGIAEAALALDLEAQGPVERYGRPGTIVTYVFELTNPMGEPIDMEVDVAGGDADVATVVPDGVVQVPARGSTRVTLAVQVPFEAEEGEELEALVFAHAVDDPSTMAIARTKTIVTRGAEAAPDETAKLIQAQQEAADNDSPGPGAAAALAAIAAVALALRQRRR